MGCSIVAREYDLCKNLGDVDMCRAFDMSKVEVPVKFSGTQGFPSRRDARYALFGPHLASSKYEKKRGS